MPDPKKIAVVGSLTIDYFTRVEHFPQPGETVMAGDLSIRFGGKGANQAVAASRLGAQVAMIGCVGNDEMGRDYIERLGAFGIGTGGIRLASGLASGSAFITLDAKAENVIVVAPGANRRITVAHIESHAALIADADCLLLQNEVPRDVNAAAISVAEANGTRIFYNPAPWRDGFSLDQNRADCLIVNETEAEKLFGYRVESPEQLAGGGGIVVTRGADSTLASLGGRLFDVAPPPTNPVDTVGAGDTFVGALAVFSDVQDAGGFAEALRLANLAASLSTQDVGAQEAMPTLDQLLAL